MKYLSILFLALSLAITSCSKNDEPIIRSTKYRIVFIYSEETTQTFEYNPTGNITEWHFLETTSSQTIADASYDYDADGCSVKINAEESHGDHQKGIFEEVLYLNQNGAAKSAGGVLVLYRIGYKSILMKKRYSVAFSYNELKQLESIQIVEKRMIDNGEDPYPLKWNIDFAWSDNNLIEYREYLTPASPLIVYEYTYYDGAGADYAPIVQRPILRAYYTPLQYQGYFGVKPKGLVKTVTVDNNYSTDYSYNISTNSMVEDYYEKSPGGKDTKYTIGWEESGTKSSIYH